MDEIVLKVDDLHVSFPHDGEYIEAVKGVTFEVSRGTTLGIVGESGSGKSVTSLAIMGLLPKTSHISGSWTDLHGHVSMIFQEPMTSLNPVQRCGKQVEEMLLAHEKVSRQEARQRTIQLFEEVMLPRPEKIYRSYPHEISGGQKQRVMIAMALICHPDLLIADEPTTALDVTVQKTIIDLLRSLQQNYHMGIIFITHDLGVIAQIADNVAVMYHGEIVEHGPAQQVLHHPQHPYTKGLLACRPPLDSRPRRLLTVKDFLEMENGELKNENYLGAAAMNVTDDTTVLLRVRDLDVTYALETSVFGKVKKELKAVDGLSFDIYRGETLGLVGESGCGKSTLGRAILQLVEHSSGTIEYDGRSLDQLTSAETKALRRKMQIVFQDPYSSLNPRITIGDAISEPLRVHRVCSGECVVDSTRGQELPTTHYPLPTKERVCTLMEQVGLDPDWYSRYPHELSGGQRQRVCIARALILQPELVVCDESVSALDVSVQAQVLNLLNDLKEQYRFTYLFITHDLSVVHYMADRILVMQKGKVVESGTPDDLFRRPQTDYTKTLIEAIPRIS